MLKKTLLLFILNVAFVNAQTECIAGMAGVYPCNDYDLMSEIPVSTLANTNGNPEGSDIWGWTDPTNGKEYAIIGMTNSTAFVDISDALNPIYLGRIDSHVGSSAFWRDIKVYNDYAFIVADMNGHGMQVFDLKRLRAVTTPQTFIPDAHYNGFGKAHNIVINESVGFAYAVGTNTFSGGVHFVDISNPLIPVAAGGYSGSGYTHDAQVITYNGNDTAHLGKEILIGSNENEVVIVDVSNKSTPTLLGNLSYTGVEYTHQGWMTDDHRYFILGDEFDEQRNGHDTRTYVFDFNDLDAPSAIGYHEASTRAIDHNGYVLGNTLYLASYRAGLRVYNISGVSSATFTEEGYFDTFPNSNGAAFNGAWSVYPYFASGNIVISDIERGLIIVRKSGTLNIPEQEAISFNMFPNPTTDNITITNNNSIINSVEINDVLGKLIKSETFSSPILSLDVNLNSFSKGVYFVKVNNLKAQKLIIQ